MVTRTWTRQNGEKATRYYAQVQVGINPKTGGRKFKRGPARKTKTEANKDRLELIKTVDRPHSPQAQLTVAEYLSQWLQHHGSQIRSKTISDYKKNIRLHIKPTIGNIPLAELTPMRLQQWQTQLTKKSAYVARSSRACLHAALNQAVIWQVLDHNPLTNVRPVKLPELNYTIWEPDQVERFITQAKDHPYYAFYYLLLSLGLRRGEARGLKWSDFVDGQVHVQRTLSDDRQLSNPKFGLPKTTKSNRWLPVPDDLEAVLEAHRQTQLETVYDSPYDLVFCTSVGTAISGSAINKAFKALCQKVGVPIIRLHDLRHTAASMWIHAGMDIQTVSGRLGHKDANTTLRIYVHESAQLLKRSGVSLSDLIRTLKKPETEID